MYQEIVDSFTEFSQLVEEKDYDEETINQFCNMDVHDDILDTIEMINDEMKKYTEQMKSHQHAPEYQIFYD